MASIIDALRIVTPIALAIISAGLRVRLFLSNQSLWIDEAALARNVLDRSWNGLLTPLDYAQIAPPGFLLMEKAVVAALGSSEQALRALSLAAGILSTWLCWRVARRMLPWFPAVCVLGLFATNRSLIEFSVQAKPYSLDIAAALAVVLLALDFFERTMSTRRAIAIGLSGGVIVAFSYSAVFVLAAGILVCLYRAAAQPRGRRGLIVAGGLWTLAVGAAVLFGRASMSATDAQYMQWYWEPGFMPWPPGARAAAWTLRRLQSFYRWTGYYRASVVWVALTGLGVWSLVKRQCAAGAVLLAGPLVLLITASALHLYPFYSGRLQVFVLPLALVLVMEGAEFLRQRTPAPFLRASHLPALMLLAIAAYSFSSGIGTDTSADFRATMAYVRTHWQTGDRLYVHYGAGQPLEYYAPRFAFSPDDYTVGSCAAVDTRAVLNDVDRLRGRSRVWIATSWVMTDVNDDGLVPYLDAVGRRLMSGAAARSAEGLASVYLYDLSGRDGSAAVSASTFPVTWDSVSNSAWSCYGVFNAERTGRRWTS